MAAEEERTVAKLLVGALELGDPVKECLVFSLEVVSVAVNQRKTWSTGRTAGEAEVRKLFWLVRCIAVGLLKAVP
jgi:hypothetical protein